MKKFFTAARLLLKRIQFYTPLRRTMLHRYEYFFWPEELAFLCKLVSESVSIPGNFVEVGCAQGATTIFLNKHLDFLQGKKLSLNSEPCLSYYCIDTFSGFTQEDVDCEVSDRNKKRTDYASYAVNNINWFNATLKQNGITRVKAFQADAKEFDFLKLGNLSFCLIDVDLYQPVKSALNSIFAQMSPGGTIVVDDCKANGKWDGALQAYQEFTAEHSLIEDIHYGKFGLIRVPNTPAIAI